MRKAVKWGLWISGGTMFTLHLMVFLSMVFGGYQPPEKFVAGWTSIACMAVALDLLFYESK